MEGKEMIPKFRIWSNDLKEMYVQSDLLITLSHSGIDVVHFDSFYEFKDYVLMQSTGLRDKNGIEIYEGDILNHPLQGMRKVYYPFNDRVASYGLENIENGMRSTLQDAHRLYEVIGNIHEHSHLLDNGGQQQ